MAAEISLTLAKNKNSFLWTLGIAEDIAGAAFFSYQMQTGIFVGYTLCQHAVKMPLPTKRAFSRQENGVCCLPNK
jgi:hypothetical protein